jgi:hypothetical protein
MIDLSIEHLALLVVCGALITTSLVYALTYMRKHDKHGFYVFCSISAFSFFFYLLHLPELVIILTVVSVLWDKNRLKCGPVVL